MVRKQGSLQAEQGTPAPARLAAPLPRRLRRLTGTCCRSWTCANYIKLPPYSTKAVMHDRLLFAIREGQGSFDLS